MSKSMFDQAQSPFFAATAHDAFAGAEASDHGEFRYEMIPSGQPFDASEVETDAQAIEITVRWQDTVLHVGHLEPGQSFSVGENGADLVLPADRLGAERICLISGQGKSSEVMLPDGANAVIEVDGRKLGREEALAAQLLRPVSGGACLSLIGTRKVSIELGDLRFDIGSVAAGRSAFGRRGGDKKHWASTVLSTALHGALVATMFLFMPSLSSTDEADLTEEQSLLLSQVLKAQAEREQPEREIEKKDEQGSAQEGGEGMGSPGERGKLGSQNSTQRNRAYAIAGDQQTRALDRAAAIKDAGNFGMAGMLATLQAGAENEPTSPWATERSGMDALSANGNMWGDILGDASGSGGLDLSGTGIGAGSFGHNVGLGSLDTAGHGSGSCATCQGFGSGRLGGGRVSKGPGGMRPGDTNVSGRIPPEVIQRVVRQNFGRFRSCYEAGLRNNPNLAGRVAVSFVVGRDGSVSAASNGGSDLPDSGVVSCVVKQFYGLSFPAPEAGVVKVTYPIMFNAN